MMKKEVRKLLLIILVSFLFVPNVSAQANTLKDLKDELAALKKQKSANDASKTKTQGEINAQNANIANSYKKIEQAKEDIETAKKNIEKSNQEIEDSKVKAANMLVFYEIMDGDQDILEYISGSETMTEMVMRTDAVALILKYNQEQIKELENKIENNKQLQVDLVKKQETLNKNITEYQNNISNLKSDLSKLDEMALDIKDEIKAREELIKYYESIGCKDNDDLSKCVNIKDNIRWYRPLTKGYISSAFGYRTITLNGKKKSGFHGGTDIAGNAGGTPVYSTLNGKVAAIIRQASCGGNQVFIHARVNGEPFTIQFVHLLEIKVKVGDDVTINTVIGTVGGGGKTLAKNGGWDTCSTGYHLHYTAATGFYLGAGKDSYQSSSTYTAHKFAAPNLPGLGQWFYSRI